MKGQLKDPALQTLLKELAVSNPGLVHCHHPPGGG